MGRSWIAFGLLAIAVASGLETGHILFYRLAHLLLAMIVVCFLWAWVGVEWVEVGRETKTPRSQVGRMAEERFAVRNRSLLPKLWLEVADHSDLPGHSASRVVSSLLPRRRTGWVVKTLCRRRGSYTLGPVSIATGDPLGLFRLERRALGAEKMIVYPATVELDGTALALSQLPGGGATHRHTHHVTTDASGVRDYQPGDSVGRVHWPSTARLDRIIVKEFDLDPMADIWLFLDMEGRVQAGRVEQEEAAFPEVYPLLLSQLAVKIPPTTEEYGVVFAASLAQHFVKQGFSLGLVACGQRREVIPADRGPRQLIKVLEALATIRAGRGVPLAELLAAEGMRLSPNATLVVITPSREANWAQSCNRLLRRGMKVRAVLLEADSFREREQALGPTNSSSRPKEEMRRDPTPADLVAVSNFPIFSVREGQDLGPALSQREIWRGR